jgi:pantoate--beta-alanine ligase
MTPTVTETDHLPPPSSREHDRRPVVVATVAELRSTLDPHRGAGRTVGFVPTMGYLHRGHASLMERAAAETDVVVASIFVNPLQFAPTEDLDAYPRDLDHDRAVARASGVEVLFVPAVDEMYPGEQVRTTVSVAELSQRWEGASRPAHFDGVTTVVAKLFNIVGPCRAYFGEKDFQQLAIVGQMVADLSIPVEVVGCPIVREPDGLAMSSRNVYLEGDDRAAATVLRRALERGRRAVLDGEADPVVVGERMAAVVAAEPRAELDYAAAVDPRTLAVPPRLGAETRLIIAARVGPTRLIDNCAVAAGEGVVSGTGASDGDGTRRSPT